MRIDTGQHLRIDQRMKLAPRMIQSMEILQMSSQELEAKLEQELSSNPTLEVREATADRQELEQEREQEKRDDREGVSVDEFAGLWEGAGFAARRNVTREQGFLPQRPRERPNRRWRGGREVTGLTRVRRNRRVLYIFTS